MAQASVLTKQLQYDLVRLVESGVSPRHAAAQLGVRCAQIEQWLARGDKGQAPYDELAAAVERAQCAYEAKLIKLVEQAAATEWRAALVLLRLSNPRVYGSGKHPVEVTLATEPDKRKPFWELSGKEARDVLEAAGVNERH